MTKPKQIVLKLNTRRSDGLVEVIHEGNVLHVAANFIDAESWANSYFKPKHIERVNGVDNFFKGKRVVVTGRMHKTRSEIEAELSAVGAIVQKAVNGSTDYLICGADVGERKTRAAEALKVKMLNRDDYRQAMSGATMAAAVHTIKPKLTHEEFVASLPETYGDW